VLFVVGGFGLGVVGDVVLPDVVNGFEVVCNGGLCVDVVIGFRVVGGVLLVVVLISFGVVEECVLFVVVFVFIVVKNIGLCFFGVVVGFIFVD